MRATEIITEAILDPSGWGNTPNSMDIDYFGLRVQMRPSAFLKLALPLGSAETNPEVEKYMKSGGKIAYPFLDIKIPEEWDDGDFSKPARVVGHEGRNRMYNWIKLHGDDPIQVNLLPRGGLRRRDFTPEWIQELGKGLIGQRGNFVSGPLFAPETVLEEEEKISPELQQLIDQATIAGNKMASSRTLRYQLYVPRKISVSEDMKPDAELWTSTAEFRGNNSYTSAWAEWCYYNMPSWLAPEGKLYEVQPGARILNIGSDEAAIKIASLFGRNYSNTGRYARLGNYPWKELGLYFDAIRYPARLKSSFTSRQNNVLMSLWDVESTAWYNTNKLKFLRTVKINTREW